MRFSVSALLFELLNQAFSLAVTDRQLRIRRQSISREIPAMIDGKKAALCRQSPSLTTTKVF